MGKVCLVAGCITLLLRLWLRLLAVLGPWLVARLATAIRLLSRVCLLKRLLATIALGCIVVLLRTWLLSLVVLLLWLLLRQRGRVASG